MQKKPRYKCKSYLTKPDCKYLNENNWCSKYRKFADKSWLCENCILYKKIEKDKKRNKLTKGYNREV